MSSIYRGYVANLPAGSTRAIELHLELMSVGFTPGVTGLNNKVVHTRSGLVDTAQLSINGALNEYKNGRRCVSVPTGLGNGFSWLYGIDVLTIRPPFAGSLAGLGQRVTRLMVSQYAPTDTPNADVGTNVIVSNSGGLTDLYTAVGTGANKSGFGVQMIGNKWCFVIKTQPATANAFAEVVQLALPAGFIAGDFFDVEFRIFDATPSQEARLELWICGALQLTRYWTNPQGVSSQLLPAFLLNTGGALLYFQHRTTSVASGPAVFADPCIIVGTNDSGTF